MISPEQIISFATAAGIEPLGRRTADGVGDVLELNAPYFSMHGFSQPVLMVSFWESPGVYTPAGTHDGIRDGAQYSRNKNPARWYYSIAALQAAGISWKGDQ